MTSAGETRSADPFIGQIVEDRYRIDKLLGAGAVGAVYRATDRAANNSYVAVKIWTTAADNDQVRGRFLREAKALSTLHHPNIVAVYGYGMIATLPYVVLEYVDGRMLEDMLGSGQPLEATPACDIMTQVLQALAYAHGLGVVHRDLKPDNVALVSNDTGYNVKLLDFGLAKFLSPADDPVAGSALTLQGMVLGTPLYMAPEQAAGRAVDVRVDVYAAGCMLFEMLSGRPPFIGETHVELVRQHLLGPIPQLTRARPEMFVAPELQQLIDRALAKVPDERFDDAGDMLEQLLKLPRPPLKPKSFYPQNDNTPFKASAAPLPAAAPAHAAASPQLSLRTTFSNARRELDASLHGTDKPTRWPLVAAVITSVCTALALAYALLH